MKGNSDMNLKINVRITAAEEISIGYKYIFVFKSDNKCYEGSFIADEKICSSKITIIVPLYFFDDHKEGMPNCLLNNLKILTYNNKQSCFGAKAKVIYKEDSKTKEQEVTWFSIDWILDQS